MGVAKQIKKILAEEEISLTELANRLDISVNNLSNKLRRDNFKTEELEIIADKLGYIVNIDFEKKTTLLSGVSTSLEFKEEEIKNMPKDMVSLMTSDAFNEAFKLILTNELEKYLQINNKELLEKAIYKIAEGNPMKDKK